MRKKYFNFSNYIYQLKKDISIQCTVCTASNTLPLFCELISVMFDLEHFAKLLLNYYLEISVPYTYAIHFLTLKGQSPF